MIESRGNYPINPGQPRAKNQPGLCGAGNRPLQQPNAGNANLEVDWPIGDVHNVLNAHHDVHNHIKRKHNEHHNQEAIRRQQYDDEFSNATDALINVVAPSL